VTDKEWAELAKEFREKAEAAAREQREREKERKLQEVTHE
jgi:hypothetical protein